LTLSKQAVLTFSVVEDPLPAAKAVSDEVLAARLEKGVSLNAEEVRGQPITCGTAGPSAPIMIKTRVQV
jgi:telomeric repeat-binding factor 2